MVVIPNRSTATLPEASSGETITDLSCSSCTQAQLTQPGEAPSPEIVQVERRPGSRSEAWQTYRNDCF
jgi:hypothetical protein